MTLPALPLACVTCMGQDHQITTIAANGAVYVMFGALALVFAGFAAVAMAFVKRAKRYAAAQAAAESGGTTLN